MKNEKNVCTEQLNEKEQEVREEIEVEESTDDVVTLRVRPGLRVRSRLRAGQSC